VVERDTPCTSKLQVVDVLTLLADVLMSYFLCDIEKP
jgi:hypothetical protein